MSSYACSYLPLPTLLLSHLILSHPSWSLPKNLHIISVLLIIQFALLPTPAAQMWQRFCFYGIVSVSRKVPKALEDSSTPHPHLLWVQFLCCIYEVISQDTAGASCNTKGKQCKLKPKSEKKRTSISSLKTATVSTEQQTTSAIF